MITDKDIASQVSASVLEISRQIDELVSIVQSKAPHADFIEFRVAAGKVLGELLLEILNPIYRMHPDLKPKELEP